MVLCDMLILLMFARRRKPTYWDFSVNCTGSEAHLSSCKLGQILALSNETCAGGMPVVVSCVPGKAFAPTPMTGYRKAFRQEVMTTMPQCSKS
ncbi:Lysyl oxidase 2B [Ataeniobius toweri]|uniref:Lysyl oxidase 2B n=1 Tax=Ataeniobius toweri TaxID=208326 RepID=A0ABU7B1E1_9TELE|nr:Lysyl oxidase 2B [Ataeniobius toweri]